MTAANKAYDKRRFREALKSGHVHKAIVEDVQRIHDGGHGKGMHKEIDFRVQQWKLHGWEAPCFTDTIQKWSFRQKIITDAPQPWCIVSKNCGGDSNLKELVDSGDAWSVANPNNPEGKPWWVVRTFRTEDCRGGGRFGELGSKCAINNSQESLEAFSVVQ